MVEAADDRRDDATKRPRIALFSATGRSDLLDEFSGQFLERALHTVHDLDSLLLGFPIDVVIVDCRNELPGREILDRLTSDGLVRFLLVGKPAERASIPSGVRSFWVPWPCDHKLFYRLVHALASDGRSRRRAESLGDALRRAAAEADLGRRTAEVLHDLANPLDAVRRFVGLARALTADEKAKSYLEDAEIGLNRMAASVTELHRDARRIGAELRLAPVRDLVRSAAVLSELLSESFTVDISLVRPDDRVHESVGRVLSNLLLNAKHACGASGRIQVRTADDDGSFVIEVIDDGAGFADLFKDELFKPYVSLSGDAAGLGLGLAHSRFLVEQIGGTLDGSSGGRGRGAVFTIRLPSSAVKRVGGKPDDRTS